MSSVRDSGYPKLALDFTRALVARDYAGAHALTSTDYQRRVAVEDVRAAFEAIVPPDGGTAGPVEVVQSMDSWPGRQASDAGWTYVSIGGDVYSEAVVVIVALEDGAMRVRDVEFGRP
jgi:hypothetical protein